MKKIFLLLIGMSIAVFLYARDFQSSWIDDASNCIGKSIDDISYSFTPGDDEGYFYVERSNAGGLFGIGARKVVKKLYANRKKSVKYAIWYMDSWNGNDEKRELEDIKETLTNRYGAPENLGNGQYSWHWKAGGIYGKEYKIGIYRDSSEGSACVLIQEPQSGFERRWKQLLGK